MKAQDIIQLLNELLALDGQSIQQLACLRVIVNQKLADHPTVPVMCAEGTEQPLLGLLGVLNGIVKLENENQFVYADYDNGALIGFRLGTPDEVD